MSYAAIRNRNSERLIALMSALAVLLSMMVIFAEPAQAHHPTITASQVCADGDTVISYTSTSWLTSGDPGSGHDDIRIQASVDGGSWIEVGQGAYTSANSYGFSGSFDGGDLGQTVWNKTVKVRAYADGPWDNQQSGGQYSDTVSVKVKKSCVNPSCPSDLLEKKIDPAKSGSYGPFKVTIASGNGGETFSWTSDVPVFQVIAKGGPGAKIYDYAGEHSGSGLHANTAPSGKYYDLSHITFCYEKGDPDPEKVEVDVDAKQCDAGQSTGKIRVDVDPDSKATVEIYSDAQMSQLVATVSSSDVIDGLDAGTYYWTATADDGYELKGKSSGTVKVEDCEVPVKKVSVDVDAKQCDAGQSTGKVSIDIDPKDRATVTVYSNEAMTEEVSSTSSDTHISLQPGTYYWQAQADNGWELTGDDHGEFTIDDCESQVEVVTSGECVVGDAGPGGLVEIDIDPEDGATVTIYSDEAMTDEVFSTSDDAEVTLEPGTYHWEAVATSGFDLAGEIEGEFTIDPCAVTVDVGGVCVVDDVVGSGQISVEISVADGATVVVTDSNSQVVATLTESGTFDASEGDTYTWSATAGPGMVVEGETSGTVDIETCSHSIELVVSGVCENNAPYLSWAATPVNFDADQVTITWNDIDSGDSLHSSIQPLNGTMPWPGTEFDSEGNVSDWAGWVLEDGIWSPGVDGYENTRPEASVTFSVNPSVTMSVDYPGGEPDCEGPPPEIFVDVTGLCDNDTPYVEYVATPSGTVDPNADTVTVRWFDADGMERDPADPEHTYSGLPLSGRVIWPGVRVDANNDPVDWPGWSLDPDDGWIRTDDGFLWAREEGVTITVEVNPTSDSVTVVYPPANPTCSANPVEDEVSDVEVTNPDVTNPDVTDEVKDAETLPFTGLDMDVLAAVAAFLLGSGMIVISRLNRRREQ